MAAFKWCEVVVAIAIEPVVLKSDFRCVARESLKQNSR
jgi:hypothetical protein